MTRLWFSAGFAALLAITTAQAAELPEAIKQAGTLRLTVNSTYAPMEYRDPTTNQLVGLDIDLANELAKRLGVKIVWSETPFAELIPSLQTKRADFIISGISDRASRRETADFIDYLATGPQFFVLAENAAKTAIDLCGKKVGTTRSTSFPIEIEKWSKQNCEADRQARRAICAGRKQHRRPQPAQAGPHRRCGARQRDACPTPRRRRSGNTASSVSRSPPAIRASCSGRTMWRCARL